MGFYVGLSTNGTLIDERMIEPIAEIGYDYVGISLDGLGETHDRFRGRDGAFADSLKARAPVPGERASRSACALP